MASWKTVGLEEDIEANRTTLAGPLFHHEIAAVRRFNSVIESAQPVAMRGLNFDAKLRRQSTDNMICFTGRLSARFPMALANGEL